MMFAAFGCAYTRAVYLVSYTPAVLAVVVAAVRPEGPLAGMIGGLL